MVECKKDDIDCPCTFGCSKHGKCCDCMSYHLKMDQLPGCVFAKISKSAEATGNRSFSNFAKLVFGK